MVQKLTRELSHRNEPQPAYAEANLGRRRWRIKVGLPLVAGVAGRLCARPTFLPPAVATSVLLPTSSIPILMLADGNNKSYSAHMYARSTSADLIYTSRTWRTWNIRTIIDPSPKLQN
jgi:hypothetical protein